MDKNIDDFISYLLFEKKYSPNTINSYKRDLNRFNEYFKNEDITKIDKKNIQTYVEELGKKLDSRSIARNISSLKSFYKFLVLNKI